MKVNQRIIFWKLHVTKSCYDKAAGLQLETLLKAMFFNYFVHIFETTIFPECLFAENYVGLRRP